MYSSNPIISSTGNLSSNAQCRSFLLLPRGHWLTGFARATGLGDEGYCIIIPASRSYWSTGWLHLPICMLTLAHPWAFGGRRGPGSCSGLQRGHGPRAHPPTRNGACTRGLLIPQVRFCQKIPGEGMRDTDLLTSFRNWLTKFLGTWESPNKEAANFWPQRAARNISLTETPARSLHLRLGCSNKSPSSPTQDVIQQMKLTEQ